MRVYIRDITLSDTNNVLKWRNSPSVRIFFIHQEEITEKEHLDWIKNKVETGLVKQFIICSVDDDKPIGSVYFSNIDYKNSKAEYGIFIGENDAKYAGCGTEAGILAVEYAFNVMKIHKIYLRVFADNIRAIKSYEKIGFVTEGFFKDDVIIKGKFADIVFMGIINNNS